MTDDLKYNGRLTIGNPENILVRPLKKIQENLFQSVIEINVGDDGCIVL